MKSKKSINLTNLGDILIINHNLILPGYQMCFKYEKGTLPYTIMNPMSKSQDQEFYGLAKLEKSKVAILIGISNLRMGTNPNDRGMIYLDVRGFCRVEVSPTKTKGRHKYASIKTEIQPLKGDTEKISKMIKEIKEKMSFPKEHFEWIKAQDDSTFADYVLFGNTMGSNYTDENRDKTIGGYIETIPVIDRIKICHELLRGEIVKEKGAGMKKIELDQGDKKIQKLNAMFNKVKDYMNEKARKKVFSELESLTQMKPPSSEYTNTLKYVEFGLDLPWNNKSKDNKISDVEKEINTTHYGMEKAKERILEYITIKKLNPDTKSTVILFNGSPGTGKTTLAKSVAKAMGRKSVRISMGSCTRPENITGFSRTFSGSDCGKIAKALCDCGTSNPVIILDEIEKMKLGSDGDPSAVLLQLLDPNQNRDFQDTYLEFGIDLRDVLFICTSNKKEELMPAVLDRMEVIETPGYSLDEKFLIARDYIIPGEAKDVGVPEVGIGESLVEHIINGYTREPGVRGLERNIRSLLTKVAVEKVAGNKITVTEELIKKRLGIPLEEPSLHTPEIGMLVNGMAYNGVGGCVLPIEGLVVKKKGKGKLIVTGQAGDVMRETIEAMKSHVSKITKSFRLKEADFLDMDIHIHMPEVAVKKDGPSASCAFALLFMSLLTGKPVKEKLSITGEATISGRVLAVGGLEEKCPVAIRSGVKDIVLPKSNYRDFVELPKKVREGAHYHFVETLNEVFEICLGLKKIESASEEKNLQFVKRNEQEEVVKETTEATISAQSS